MTYFYIGFSSIKTDETIRTLFNFCNINNTYRAVITTGDQWVPPLKLDKSINKLEIKILTNYLEANKPYVVLLYVIAMHKTFIVSNRNIYLPDLWLHWYKKPPYYKHSSLRQMLHLKNYKKWVKYTLCSRSIVAHFLLELRIF